MTKATVEAFIKALEENGITEYDLVVANSDLHVYNNESGRVFLDADCVTYISYKRDYKKPGAFDIHQIPYDSIEFIGSMSIGFNESIAIMNKLGHPISEFEDFVKAAPVEKQLYTNKNGSNGGIAPMTDKDGNLILPPGTSGYVV